VRVAGGTDFPVWVKLDSRELGKRVGTTLDDAKRVAVMLERAGADAITVTAHHDVGQGKLHSASNTPHESEANIPATAEIKAEVMLPVIASGRVELASADVKIGLDAFDMLAMGRKIRAEPAAPAGRMTAVPVFIAIPASAPPMYASQ